MNLNLKIFNKTDLVMEHPKMSRNYIRVAHEIDEIPTQQEIGLTHNDDDQKESKSCQTTPLYYHPGGKIIAKPRKYICPNCGLGHSIYDDKLSQ